MSLSSNETKPKIIAEILGLDENDIYSEDIKQFLENNPSLPEVPPFDFENLKELKWASVVALNAGMTPVPVVMNT